MAIKTLNRGTALIAAFAVVAVLAMAAFAATAGSAGSGLKAPSASDLNLPFGGKTVDGTASRRK